MRRLDAFLAPPGVRSMVLECCAAADLDSSHPVVERARRLAAALARQPACLRARDPARDLQRAARVFDRNARRVRGGVAIYDVGSTLNHACDANTATRGDGPVFASRRVRAGEELTTDYLGGALMPRHARRRCLLRSKLSCARAPRAGGATGPRRSARRSAKRSACAPCRARSARPRARGTRRRVCPRRALSNLGRSPRGWKPCAPRRRRRGMPCPWSRPTAPSASGRAPPAGAASSPRRESRPKRSDLARVGRGTCRARPPAASVPAGCPPHGGGGGRGGGGRGAAVVTPAIVFRATRLPHPRSLFGGRAAVLTVPCAAPEADSRRGTRRWSARAPRLRGAGHLSLCARALGPPPADAARRDTARSRSLPRRQKRQNRCLWPSASGGSTGSGRGPLRSVARPSFASRRSTGCSHGDFSSRATHKARRGASNGRCHPAGSCTDWVADQPYYHYYIFLTGS